MQKIKTFAFFMLVLLMANLSIKFTTNPAMSWWFATAPLWLPILFIAISLTFVAAFIAVAAIISRDAK